MEQAEELRWEACGFQGRACNCLVPPLGTAEDVAAELDSPASSRTQEKPTSNSSVHAGPIRL